MAGFSTFSSTSVTSSNDLATEIITAYTSAGSTVWYEPVANGDLYSADKKTRQYLVKSTADVDAFQLIDPTQIYYVLFTMTYDIEYDQPNAKVINMRMDIGNDLQIAFNSGGTAIVVQSGTLGWTIFGGSVIPSDTSEFNYRITFTDRGSAMAIWRSNTVNRVENNFVCVMQRPVNPTNGLPKVEGSAPIFALWHSSNNTTNYFNWGVVREKDKPASIALGNTNVVSRYNMYRITLEWSHPNLFDNNSHVVKFPYGFATSRHLYLDELDLLCLVNATAFAGQQDASITMYGEAEERKYRTAWGEVLYGNVAGTLTPQPKVVSGARIGILSAGGGIDPI